MSQAVDTREVRVIDELGFDITDRIILEYGSVQAALDYGDAMCQFLEDAARRLAEPEPHLGSAFIRA
jgi:hypothetical protein